ncbi:DUF6146 family protein [Robiginitalea sp. M366]|uniref:DUF6146 family protein n=1 Tax=Robiginitalea aestuariiviva TaxID=3036903 RepID=UPI00240E3BFD|nr:DUF6146 family protein [Robiginitalea aestuariiviva]MDG1573005.1 DUF6146 family protein [Robiginitalea aestuariiviva]
MKTLPFMLLGLVLASAMACGTPKGIEVSETEREIFARQTPDSVRIADAESQYEIVIIDPGFYNWLVSVAKPEGYYSQTFLETRNAIYVTNWNQRALLPRQYDSSLYVWPIDYDPKINYGYEVNYKLYNYFIYFQRKYNQRLGPFLPRI